MNMFKYLMMCSAAAICNPTGSTICGFGQKCTLGKCFWDGNIFNWIYEDYNIYCINGKCSKKIT